MTYDEWTSKKYAFEYRSMVGMYEYSGDIMKEAYKKMLNMEQFERDAIREAIKNLDEETFNAMISREISCLN